MADKDAQKNNAEKPVVASKADTGNAYTILLKPLVTEKSYTGAAKLKMMFKVNPKSNKIMIKNAVQTVFDVKVKDVNIINVKGKVRTFGRTRGKTSAWKKAVVTLMPGESVPGAQL